MLFDPCVATQSESRFSLIGSPTTVVVPKLNHYFLGTKNQEIRDRFKMKTFFGDYYCFRDEN